MDITSEMAGDREDDSGIESTIPDSGETGVYIRIAVTDLKIQKCLQFSLDDSVWIAKQRVLNTLAKDIRDGLNYGLYCPPMNGRAGKFLDEERPLRDYPLPGPIGFLEFKYKRRVYKQMQINPRKLKQLHTKANTKQFMEAVKANQVEKVIKFSNRGLDPNFHDHDSGETPLTQAVQLDKPRQMIISLISGGAHIDFRNKSGLTAMHRAAIAGNLESIKTLLDLGSSPNYKDGRGLTPLYHCVLHDSNAHCVELLLHDHSIIGITDERGWCEIHHACKDGRVQHLEHLLFYGADMNLQNTSGNTALHISAVNNAESCARVLLFRGVDKTIQNYAHQDAFQVAVIAGNIELAEIIKGFKPQDVVPFQEVPKYNEKRRATLTATMFGLQRSRSDPRLNQVFSMDSPVSPNLSNNSYSHYTSNGNLFESPGSGMMRRQSFDSDSSPRSMSISSAGSLSGFSGVSDYSSHSVGSGYAGWSAYNLYHRRSSVVSDSLLYSYSRKRLYAATPGRRFICTQPFTPEEEGELALRRGQIVEVISVGEGGYWEGRSKNAEGWFPSTHVQEIRMRRRASTIGTRSAPIEEDTVLVNRKTLAALTAGAGDNTPRTVVLQKGNSGFGFVLRGAKAQSSPSLPLEFSPSPDFPALQYLDRVDKGSPADRAGLKPGDFLLEINNEVVVNATHEHTVRLIKNSGGTLAMKVITVKPLPIHGPSQDIHMDGTRTLPLKKKEKLDLALEAYDSGMHSPQADSDLQHLATLRRVDADNKTASIRSRPNSQRLTGSEMEQLMRMEQAGVDVNRSASHQDKPVVATPKIYSSVSGMKNKGRTSLNRANSTPNLAPNAVAAQQDEESYTAHITRLDVNQPSTPLGHTWYKETERQTHIYAVPNQEVRQYGSVENLRKTPVIPPRPHEIGPIPPPPDHPPPQPPTNDQGEFVAINTISPIYSNVSASIMRDKRMSTDGFESSFRPGKNARMSKEPAELPPGVRSAHSRTNSTVSSSSEQSDGQRGSGSYSMVAADKPPTEPAPDYDLPPKVVAPTIHSLRETYEVREANGGTQRRLTPPNMRQQVPAHSTPTPPPPPPPQMPPVVKSQAPATPQKSTIPERGDSHAALMAAINQRRHLVDNATSQTPAKSQPAPKKTPPPPPTSPPPNEESPNFLALAEKRRQEYLLKRAAATLDRRKPDSPKSAAPPPPAPQSTPPPPPPLNLIPPPPPPIKSTSDKSEDEKETKGKPNNNCSPKPSQPRNGNESNEGSPGLGGLAAIIAQKALERQKTADNTVDSNGNQVDKTNSNRTIYRSGTPSANGPSGTRLVASPGPAVTPNGSRVNIKGATMDSSSTETLRRTPGGGQREDGDSNGMSVAQRTRLFEAQKRAGGHATRNTPSGESHERPPPMVPPVHMDSNLDIVTNSHHSNGHDTVGWIINSGPNTAHEANIQNKIAQYNISRSSGLQVGDSGNVGQMAYMHDPVVDIQLDFIPPPPLFDTAEDGIPPGGDYSTKIISEDAASLVSSLSTLSTLSSNEQDSYTTHDSSGYSSSRGGRAAPSQTSSQSDELYIEIAPPPPAFDDTLGTLTSEPHYEELPLAACIPPPMEFNSASQEPPVNARSRDNDHYENVAIEKWTVAAVANWLRNIGLGQYSHAFTSRSINGQRLLNLGRNELIAMGMTQVGHRIALERAINLAKLR